jgi:hypothetical protein
MLELSGPELRVVDTLLLKAALECSEFPYPLVLPNIAKPLSVVEDIIRLVFTLALIIFCSIPTFFFKPPTTMSFKAFLLF